MGKHKTAGVFHTCHSQYPHFRVAAAVWEMIVRPRPPYFAQSAPREQRLPPMISLQFWCRTYLWIEPKCCFLLNLTHFGKCFNFRGRGRGGRGGIVFIHQGAAGGGDIIARPQRGPS